MFFSSKIHRLLSLIVVVGKIKKLTLDGEETKTGEQNIPFEQRAYLDNLVLKAGLALLLLAGGADGGEVGDNLLRVLRLSSARLTSATCTV